jgi:hypothetical protein
MMQVSNFEQVRADGNVIPAEMTVREMLALGWGPAKVVALRWSHDGKAVECAAPNGVHGIAVPGGNFVAGIVDEDASGAKTQLVVFSPDGSKRGALDNRLRVLGTGAEVNGRFGWFEPAMSPEADKFGAIFQAGAEGDFRCDIDAGDLRILAVTRIR